MSLFHALIGMVSPGFYVSNSGSSSNSGRSASAPWDVATFVSHAFSAGEKIYFNKGEVYSIGNYSVAVNNLTFSSYGSGARPIFIGSTDIGAQVWTSEGSSIYSTPWTNPFKWVYVDDVAARLAESPWYPITTQADSTHLNATTLNGAWGSSVSGALAIVKEYYFSYSHVRTVTAYSAGQITLDAAVNTGLVGYSFKLFNQLQFLTEQFEFFYDGSKIYYRHSGGTPSGINIRVSTYDSAIIVADGVSGTIFDGLEFTHYHQNAITGKDNSGTIITNCNFQDLRTDAIFMYGDNVGTEITNNTFLRNECNAIYTGAISDFNFSNNTFTTIGRGRSIPFLINRGTGFSYYQQELACGIAQTWDETVIAKVPLNGVIEYNEFSDIGYCGMLFLGSNHTVRYNKLNACMVDFTDGAGIYTINHPEAPYGGQGTNCNVSYNIVSNCIGSQANVPSTTDYITYGIYIDINCSNFIIDHNTIMDCTQGTININYGCSNHTITNNHLIGGVFGLNFVNFLGSPIDLGNNQGHDVSDNVFVTRNTTQRCIRVLSLDGNTSYNPFTDGNCDNNIYITPYTGNMGVMSIGSVSYDLAGWRTKYGDDAASVGMASFITFTSATDALEEIQVITNWTGAAVDTNIDAGYSGWKDVDGNVVTSTTQSVPSYYSYIYLSISGSKNVRYINNSNGVFSGTSGASLTPSYMASLVSGDLLIIDVFVASGNLTIGTPAGWTLLYLDVAGSSRKAQFWKISDGTESGTVTITFTAGAVAKVARMYQFRYSAISSFEESAVTGISSGTTLTGPSLTGTGKRGLGVSFVSFFNNSPAIAPYSGTTGGTWVDTNDYAPNAGAAIDLFRVDIRTPATVSGGTCTTGAAGATTRSLILKTLVP